MSFRPLVLEKWLTSDYISENMQGTGFIDDRGSIYPHENIINKEIIDKNSYTDIKVESLLIDFDDWVNK
ncbi:hypothetical protein [Mucispirillum schaedleri]|uniref:hypothetical protein n=1 Tax=Mucispirillum schaedleri TaxID=248039 RepID=UPI001F562B58|nr:hypothetical protein [Mucispirillum schaedleri]